MSDFIDFRLQFWDPDLFGRFFIDVLGFDSRRLCSGFIQLVLQTRDSSMELFNPRQILFYL